jgi:hypothetical protein
MVDSVSSAVNCDDAIDDAPSGCASAVELFTASFRTCGNR